MGGHRGTARAVGSFFIISNVVFITGAAILIEPILGAPDYLTALSGHRGQIVLGALLELLNAVAYLGIAVFMFPVFKARYEALALGYIAFRTLEFVMQILTDLSPLALLSLSDSLAQTGSIGPAMETAGSLLVAQRYWAFQMVSLTMGAGGLLFYTMLYQLRLVPRFLSIWGLLGVVIVLANALFDMFGITVPNLGLLMLANELILGGWLIVRGFRDPQPRVEAPVPA